VLRRILLAVVFVACVVVVVGYQATRPAKGASSPRVFVPSAKFFTDFSPSFRTTIADAYWLKTVQYYGEHVSGDRKFDSLWPMLDLVTRLSPHFVRAYRFGAFALLDAGRADLAYELLERGHTANPGEWSLLTHLGFFMYNYGSSDDKAVIAAGWYQQASRLPGAPAWVGRVAARLLTKGGERQKAAMQWAQVYGVGDQYSRKQAIDSIDGLLSKDPAARQREVASLSEFVPPELFDQFSQALLGGDR
jgi:hypothetical protein